MLPESPKGMLRARLPETSVLMKKNDDTFIVTIADIYDGTLNVV